MASSRRNGLLARLTSSFRPISGYQAYGLRLEDFYNSEKPAIQEALRRLPKNVKEERDLRVHRGLELALKNNKLPEAYWTTPEEDSESYIEPYLSEVVEEIEQRENYRAGFPTPVEVIYLGLRFSK